MDAEKRAEGIEERAERRCGMITVLSRQHNIISVGPEDVPENRKGQLIAYLPEWDAVVIAGWEENTALITELIIEYLELTHSQHKKALLAPVRVGLSGAALEICEALDKIYQIRRGKEQRKAVG